MPTYESTQHKLDRIRSPRVHITYDVELNGAMEKKELPFVIGVLADLSGKPDPDRPLPKLSDRKFVQIDRDNFNDIMKSIQPRLAFQVDNELQGDGSKLNVELKFNNIDDFDPEQVARQVEPLNKLLQTRRDLEALLAKTDGNGKLEELLNQIVSSPDTLRRLRDESHKAE